VNSALDAAPATAYVNGRIITMDENHPTAAELIVRDGRILAVGGPGLAGGAGASLRQVDLSGRTVIPGFVDAHCHLELFSTHLTYAVQCFVPPHRSIADIATTLRTAAASAGPGEWVIGRAEFSVHLFVAEQRPITRQDLDEAVPDHPCVVFSGMHYCALNSRALEVTGLLDGAVLPRGSTIDLASGRGTELWDWLPLPPFGVDRVAAAIRDRAADRFRSRGVTSIAEMPASREGVHAYQRLHRAGELPVRISLRYHVPRICGVDDLAAVGLEAGFGDEWLEIGGVKAFVDGAGADLDGVPGADIKWSQAELDHIVRTAHDAGLQVMLHVQSEQAVDMALTALERTLAASPRAGHRHRLEHLGDLPLGPAWRDRVRALGVIPVATPQFIYSYGDWFPAANDPPLRTLRSMGFRVPGNSDSTGTQPEAANPFHGIWCAIARRTRNGTVLSPEERIGIDEALRMFTADAAFASGLDDRGTLAPGQLADFVVLGRDPRDMEIDELPDTPVDFTVVGGKAWETGRSAPGSGPRQMAAG
jgi:predicted amidohydrolase YtcJ